MTDDRRDPASQPETPPSNGSKPEAPPPRRWSQRALDGIEWAGNKLPDPAMLFVIALLLTWGLSLALSYVEFSQIDPRTFGKKPAPIQVVNQLSGPALATFLSKMVKTFTSFHPLGVVLVALLGVGVAEHTGFINAAIKGLMSFTPRQLLTPMLLLVAIISHTAGDTGYVLVVPLGGVIFYAAGRHPLAGILAAFAGVSGGFSANFMPSPLDTLLQGITQQSGQLLDGDLKVNPLCNLGFTATSCLAIIGVGWYLTDRVIEPRLRNTAVDGDPQDMPKFESLTERELTGLWAGLASMAVGLLLLVAVCLPKTSSLRSPSGELAAPGAPLMDAIVPLIFLLFLLPGVVYGWAAGTVHSHRDIVKGMSKSMSTMGYYLVMAFFASQFIYAFGESNLGALLAVYGAAGLKALGLPAQVTILGIIIITALVNLLIGSASAKWALLGPIFVPMLMQLGISPELTQAAYRVGDSCTNIVTPLMPYFPLILVYCQRYVKDTGTGTLIALMLPYSLTFLATWTVVLLVYWSIGLPLGLQASYTYP